jgi:hypothetical protein
VLKITILTPIKINKAGKKKKINYTHPPTTQLRMIGGWVIEIKAYKDT